MAEEKGFFNGWYPGLPRQEKISYPGWTVYFMAFPILMRISMKN